MSGTPHAPHGAHEARDISMRAVVWSAAGFMALTALGLAVCALYFGVLAPSHPTQAGRSMRGHEAAAQALPPAPRLQVSPQADMKAMRAQEDELLHGYGWVDKPGGKVRIPIDRAMEIVARRGTK